MRFVVLQHTASETVNEKVFIFTNPVLHSYVTDIFNQMVIHFLQKRVSNSKLSYKTNPCVTLCLFQVCTFQSNMSITETSYAFKAF